MEGSGAPVTVFAHGLTNSCMELAAFTPMGGWLLVVLPLSGSTGDGDLVSDVTAGRSSLSTIKEEELPDNLRALKPEARSDELNKQMSQRKEPLTPPLLAAPATSVATDSTPPGAV